MGNTIYRKALWIGTDQLPLLFTEQAESNCYDEMGINPYSWSFQGVKSLDQFTTETLTYRDKLAARNAEFQAKYPNWGEYKDAQFGWYAAIQLDGKEAGQTSLADYLAIFQKAPIYSVEELPYSLKLEPKYWKKDEILATGKPYPRPVNIANSTEINFLLPKWVADYGSLFYCTLN